jgi:hypothetical protein
MSTAVAFPPSTSPLAILGGVSLESLTVSADAMPGHYVDRAVIFDLQPTQMVAALIATMDAITVTHRFARRTGWSATSDGLRIYFSA